MRKLTEALHKKGVDIDVCTTKTHSISPLIKSGVIWDNKLENENVNGINVIRFPVKNPNKYVAMLFEKLIQGRLDHEEDAAENNILNSIDRSFNEKGGLLLSGWNHLERYGSSSMRWTRRKASALINDENVREVAISISNPKKIAGDLTITANEYKRVVPLPRNVKCGRLAVDLPKIYGKIYLTIRLEKTWKPLKDYRQLGVCVSDITYRIDERRTVDLEYDYKKYLSKKGSFVSHLFNLASTRPKFYCSLFDYLRGPDSREMTRWLRRHAQGYDVIMVQMFPFNTVKNSIISKGNTPLVITPLMHVDDDFYHWPHYYEYLQNADGIFAMSGYSKKKLFDDLCPATVVIGAGIDQSTYIDDQVNGDVFKDKYGLNDKKLVLTVSRKSLAKRYDLLVKAVEKVSEKIKNVHLVMIGPDEDKLPIDSKKVSYLGKLPDEDLVNAYDACDVFAMMSESESFGMVFCEAWSRKKPVIGNIYCGAVASLIEEGRDGYLCGNADDIADKIELLLSDHDLSQNIGEKGYDKVMNYYTWDKVADRVYDYYKLLTSGNKND